MKTFEQWLKDNYNEELPAGQVSGGWFAERGLPMVVKCSDCETTMSLPSAYIADDGSVYCAQCAN
jgi:hypothetical protein